MPELLTVPEAATRLRVSKSFLDKVRCTGGGPPFLLIGRTVRYSAADLDQWLAGRRRTSTSDPGEAA